MNKLAFSIGPLVVPTQLAVLLICVGVAAAVGHLAGRRQRAGIGSTLIDMLLAGVVAARIGFVVLWFDQYRSAPWTMLDIRDGGYMPWAGIVAAGLVAIWQARRQPVLRKPLALGLLAGAFGWLAVPGALRFGVEPTLAELDTVSLVTPQGQPASLRALAGGKPMVINLWATWCPPCRHEMPVLAAAQQQEKDVSFVFANQGEDVATLRRYLDEVQLVLANVLLDPGKSMGQTYGSMALPTTLFYDAGGRLVDTHLGPLSRASLASKLKQLQAPDDAESKLRSQ